MKLDSDQIEGIGIRAIENAFALCDNVRPRLVKSEKGESWDGEFYYYSSDEKTVKHLELTCKVQVKGKTVSRKEFGKKVITYPVDTTQMRVYRKNGGVLYFVVQILKDDPDKTQAYYNKLLPYDLSGFLERKGHQVKISIPFKKLPDSRGQLNRLVKTFIHNSEAQRNTTSDKIPTMDELDKMNVPWKYVVHGSLEELFEDSAYIYRMHPDVPHYLEAVLKIEHLERAIAHHDGIDVKVDGKKLFSSIDFVYEQSQQAIMISNCITIIDTGDSQYKIIFKPHGTIDEIVNGIKFLNALETGKTLQIGKCAGSFSINEHFSMSQALEYYEKLQLLFRKLRIKRRMNFEKLSSKDEAVLLMLYDCIVEGKYIELQKPPDNPAFVCTIGGLQIAVLIENDKKGHYLYRDFFYSKASNCIAKFETGEHFDTTLDVLLKKNHFKSLDNISYSAIQKHVKNIKYNEFHGERVNELLLEMLSAYDEQPNAELLDAAIAIARYLRNNSKTPYSVMNYYQTKARKASLTKSDIKNLNEFKKTLNGDDAYCLAGIAILIGDSQEFDRQFAHLSKEMQISFQRMPIMRLVKR